MSSRSISGSIRRSSGGVTRRLAVLVAATTVLVVLLVGAGSARASYYQMVLCAANNGSNGFATATNTTSPQNLGGIFSFENYCGPAPFPAGNNAFLRLDENQPSGNAGYTAYGSMSWTPPPWIAIVAGGGYTRMPGSFNAGWRGRFWAEGWDGSTNNILVQGNGVANGDCGGVCWASCSAFCSHLWPFGGYGDYRRFVFEMTCYNQNGCDRSGFNAVDANTIILTLADRFDSQVGWSGNTPFMSSQWTRGAQTATYTWNELGSGIRNEWIDIDSARRFTIDHQATGECNRDNWGGVGEFARDFSPCAQATGIGRAYTFDTASLSDGAHWMVACTQDYGQWYSGQSSCVGRTIYTDNTAPGAASGLAVTSSNAQRYMDHFDASFALPPNQGSPISKIHYDVVNAAGEVVQPEKTVSGTNPTELKNIEGPKASGSYRLRIWLEDQVGWVGPATSAPIPHDTVPPAAPQQVAVAPPETSRQQQGFDVTWHNITDNGSPIDEAHYQVLNPAGAVVVPTKTLTGDNVQSIENLETPSEKGKFTLRLWLSDAEGNVGAPISAPLAYECVRSPVAGGQQLTAEFGDSDQKTVKQGEGATVSGDLKGSGGDIGGAPLCIFSNPATDTEREFLGMAVTGSHGDYRFAIPQGPSRKISVLYRPNQRQMSAAATLLTIVHPTFKAKKSVVENHHFAYFEGDIPGPHNNQVVIVLQVRSGKGWLAFRRYRTRDNGHFELAYRFNRTNRPTTYEMRAQVRQTTGYPYEQGNSDPLILKVVPDTGKNPEPTPNAEKHRCPKGKRAVKKVVKRGHKKTKKVVCVKVKKKKHHPGTVHH
jgi:hypothetical protein